MGLEEGVTLINQQTKLKLKLNSGGKLVNVLVQAKCFEVASIT